MTNEMITAKLALAIAETGNVKQAWESVFGPGSYESLAGVIYDELKAAAN